MTTEQSLQPAPTHLPPHVDAPFQDFLSAARAVFSGRLLSVVLIGSAAEQRLRPTSDVNLILVLTEFRQEDADALAPALTAGRAAVRLEVMLLLEREIAAAAECFAQKFADIRRRRIVVLGPDPFAHLVIPRGAEILRLRQVLLNLILRTRYAYALRRRYDDQLAALVAEIAGPLRTCAAALLELSGASAPSPREALERTATAWGDAAITAAVAKLPEVRETRVLPDGTAAATIFALLDAAERLRRTALELQP